MDNHPALVLKREKQKILEENHRKFDEFHKKYPKRKARIFYYIPVSSINIYLNEDLDLDTPFERIRLIGKYTNRGTLRDLHKTDEVKLCLDALELYPVFDKFLEVFGSVSTLHERKFQVYFFAEVSETEAIQSELDLLNKQKKYYENIFDNF